MSAAGNARLLVLGGTPAVLEALAAHCAPAATAALPDAAAARACLRANRTTLPRLMVVDATGVDPVSAVTAIKSDAQARTVPLLVLCKAADTVLLDSCYRAGANACVVVPAGEAALREMAGTLAGFWLGANETPPADA